MKTIRETTGPFRERPYYTEEEIERICSTELKQAGLYPTTPGPIRIERFIEKRLRRNRSLGSTPALSANFTFGGRYRR